MLNWRRKRKPDLAGDSEALEGEVDVAEAGVVIEAVGGQRHRRWLEAPTGRRHQAHHVLTFLVHWHKVITCLPHPHSPRDKRKSKYRQLGCQFSYEM